MRVPLSWLREYVDIDLPVPELAELLTNAGLEVESIETIGLPGAELELSLIHISEPTRPY